MQLFINLMILTRNKRTYRVGLSVLHIE